MTPDRGARPAFAKGGPVERKCIFCGSPDVNLWKSWNEVGEWTCDECTPADPGASDEEGQQ